MAQDMTIVVTIKPTQRILIFIAKPPPKDRVFSVAGGVHCC